MTKHAPIVEVGVFVDQERRHVFVAASTSSLVLRKRVQTPVGRRHFGRRWCHQRIVHAHREQVRIFGDMQGAVRRKVRSSPIR